MSPVSPSQGAAGQSGATPSPGPGGWRAGAQSGPSSSGLGQRPGTAIPWGVAGVAAGGQSGFYERDQEVSSLFLGALGTLPRGTQRRLGAPVK